MDMSKTVAEVIALVECYVANNGDYLGQSVKPGRGWSKRFAEFDVPSEVSRRQIFELVSVENEKASDERNWKKIFIWTMAWGYGPGYGAWRTDRILKNLEPHQWLSELACELGPSGRASVGDAYKWLHEDWKSKKKGLGPAFATKLLYVLSEKNNRAPIIDAVVSSWLKRQGLPVSSTSYVEREYGDYVHFVDNCLDRIRQLVEQKSISHIDEFSDRGFIEYLIFQDELFQRKRFSRVVDWRKSCG